MDLLNKIAYDSDKSVSKSEILALGLIGAGTNNSRSTKSSIQYKYMKNKLTDEITDKSCILSFLVPYIGKSNFFGLILLYNKKNYCFIML